MKKKVFRERYYDKNNIPEEIVLVKTKEGLEVKEVKPKKKKGEKNDSNNTDK